MRAPVDRIAAPPFLTHLRWVNSKPLRMERLYGRPVLVEFWDFCRPNSLRTLPYVKAWHERYAQLSPGESNPEPVTTGDRDGADPQETDRGAGKPGLQVIGIHSPGFEPARDRKAAQDAIARLGVEYPVLLDPELEMWREYENAGWPARYLFDARGALFEYHYGEGAYAETERAIQELLGIEREPLPPQRPEDDPDAQLVPQTEDQPGAYNGPYEAGGVWAVLEGSGMVRVNTEPAAGAAAKDSATEVRTGGATIELSVTHPGAYRLIEHDRHTTGVLEFELDPGARCYATCFTPGRA